MEISDLIIKSPKCSPNQEYLQLKKVGISATGNAGNKVITMENLGDGTFMATEGLEDIKIGTSKPRKRVMPMESWEGYYQKLTTGNNAYSVTATAKQKLIVKEMATDDSEHLAIDDEEIKELVRYLLAAQGQYIQDTLKMSFRDIPQNMLEHGEKVLEYMAMNCDTLSVTEFRNLQEILYTAIPRRTRNMNKMFATQKTDFPTIIDREQEFLSLLLSVIRADENKEEIVTERDSFLKNNGISIGHVDRETQEKLIEKYLGRHKGRVLDIYQVTNFEGQDRFNKFLTGHDLTKADITMLCHGSPSRNWWSIFRTNLNIAPQAVMKDVEIHGKAYGNGIYFGLSADKSCNYVSSHNAKYTTGDGGNYAFMGLYDVITGKKGTMYKGDRGCDSSLNWSKLQTIKPGAWCTWAESRYSGFMMDEVIVYQNEQANIRYLVKLAA